MSSAGRSKQQAYTLACGQHDGVTIRMMDGRRIRLADVSFSDTVDKLKRRIFRTLQNPCKNSGLESGEAWPPEKQKLWAYGCYLENGRTLSDYHLKSEDRIHLTLRVDE